MSSHAISTSRVVRLPPSLLGLVILGDVDQFNLVCLLSLMKLSRYFFTLLYAITINAKSIAVDMAADDNTSVLFELKSKKLTCELVSTLVTCCCIWPPSVDPCPPCEIHCMPHSLSQGS